MKSRIELAQVAALIGIGWTLFAFIPNNINWAARFLAAIFLFASTVGFLWSDETKRGE